jgi:hypothetical protein
VVGVTLRVSNPAQVYELVAASATVSMLDKPDLTLGILGVRPDACRDAPFRWGRRF